MYKIAGLVVIFIILIFNMSNAEDWLPITESDWAITSGVDSLDDDGVIIFNRGKVITEIRGVELDHYVRIMPFTKKGVQKVKTLKIDCDTKDKVKALKVRIVKPDGQVIRYNSKNFAKTEDGSKKLFIFSLDRLNPGDIVEYRYKIAYHGDIDENGPEKFLLFNQNVLHTKREKSKIVYYREWEGLLDKKITNLPSWYFDGSLYFRIGACDQAWR